MPPDWTFDWYEHATGNDSVRVVPNRADRRRAARKQTRRRR